jgi:hypothetical protein
LTKRILPIFYEEETFHAIPFVAKAGNRFLVVVDSQDGWKEIQTLLDHLGVDAGQYRIWRREPGTDPVGILSEADQEFSSGSHPYPVDPRRPRWLEELLAGLEEEGILPVGNLAPALQAVQDYLTFA